MADGLWNKVINLNPLKQAGDVIATANQAAGGQPPAAGPPPGPGNPGYEAARAQWQKAIQVSPPVKTEPVPGQ